jgi:hypothetical protein
MIGTLDVLCAKSYPLGLWVRCKLATLAEANSRGNYRNFKESALARIFRLKLIVKFLLTILLPLTFVLEPFLEGRVPQNKGRVKIYPLFDIKTQIPVFVCFTNVSVNEVYAIDYIPNEGGSYYIFDR